MKIPCSHCCSSGNYMQYVEYLGYHITNPVAINYEIGPCKYCKGTGWIDEDEIIQVPRKFIKDEYFK